MAELRREMKDGSVYDANKKVELSDEALEKIQGGIWSYAAEVGQDQWNEVFGGRPVLWREYGVMDHWGRVISYNSIGDAIYTFDLDLPYENMFVFDVPARDVLVEI